MVDIKDTKYGKLVAKAEALWKGGASNMACIGAEADAHDHAQRGYPTALELLLRVHETKMRCVRSAGMPSQLKQAMADHRDAHKTIQAYLKDIEGVTP